MKKQSNSTHFKLIFILFLAVFTCGNLLAQFDIPAKPDLETSVYDYAGLLSPSDKSRLENKLVRYSDTTSTQMVVAIINSTQGEDISLLGAKWGQQWGIGQKQEDNGLLILLAKDDRQVDINTGYGIETIITDRMAERVINRVMIPQFKNGNYYAGLDQGTDALREMLLGEYQGERVQRQPGFVELVKRYAPMLVFIVIIIIILSRGGGGRNGGRRRGGGLLDIIILSSLGRGGFGGGSGGGGFGGGGGGGFGGGFGGGGFGGGGASGGW